MNPSSPEARHRADHPRLRSARNALLWIGVIVLALVPFPWWW